MTSTTKWTQTYPADFAAEAAADFVAVKDGETTFCALRHGRSLLAMAEDYASGYGFNEPGDVAIRVYAHDASGEETDMERYTIRSIDGIRGALI